MALNSQQLRLVATASSDARAYAMSTVQPWMVKPDAAGLAKISHTNAEKVDLAFIKSTFGALKQGQYLDWTLMGVTKQESGTVRGTFVRLKTKADFEKRTGDVFLELLEQGGTWRLWGLKVLN